MVKISVLQIASVTLEVTQDRQHSRCSPGNSYTTWLESPCALEAWLWRSITGFSGVPECGLVGTHSFFRSKNPRLRITKASVGARPSTIRIRIETHWIPRVEVFLVGRQDAEGVSQLWIIYHVILRTSRTLQQGRGFDFRGCWIGQLLLSFSIVKRSIRRTRDCKIVGIQLRITHIAITYMF